MTNNDVFTIRFAEEFEKELYQLSKKYRNIRQDVEPILEQLQQGIFLGDRLAGFGLDIYIYKVRVKNSNIKKGKSAGYRLIYLFKSQTNILLLTSYSKSEQEDISINKINLILNECLEEE